MVNPFYQHQVLNNPKYTEATFEQPDIFQDMTFDLAGHARDENQCKMGDYECEKCFTPLKGYEYFGSTPCIICGHENCDLPF